ncbi:hypothetical protein [Ramlibacter humi]|uniref:Uncharacterized protein n=1 Tax=Ramlibacter humi TaxID=2530451 RepID=A0A4Z0BP18_9BURK|nr:hypothetical protein [Ramlibacter humi]TFZ00174.1 hypothetical protein EZ216_13785 [Ramlibacter humi]
MDRRDSKMHKILPATLLCLALSPALAADAPGNTTVAQNSPAQTDGIVHASLMVPAGPASPAAKAQTPTLHAPAAPEPKGERDHGAGAGGMLLAAIALMLGIVLRRWGTGQQ